MAKNTLKMEMSDPAMIKKMSGLKTGAVVHLHHKIKVTKVHDREEPDYDSPSVGDVKASRKRMLTIEGDVNSVDPDQNSPARGGKLGKVDGQEVNKSPAAKAVLAMR